MLLSDLQQKTGNFARQVAPKSLAYMARAQALEEMANEAA
jgi:hypothetical protein